MDEHIKAHMYTVESIGMSYEAQFIVFIVGAGEGGKFLILVDPDLSHPQLGSLVAGSGAVSIPAASLLSVE